MGKDIFLDYEFKDTIKYDEAYFRDRLKSEREFVVFSYRMGFSDGKRHSLEETANKFGITRERVRVIESKAFRPHCVFRRNGLKRFLDD